MSSKNEEKLDEIVGSLEGIIDRLEDISSGIEEINITLQLVGFMLIADRLAEKRPELEEKLEPLIQSWIKAMEEGSVLDEVEED